MITFTGHNSFSLRLVTECETRERNTYIANECRRIILADIPSLALDEIDFSLNRTSFPNEYLGHRLSLIPIPSSLFQPGEELDLYATGKCNLLSKSLIPELSEPIYICPLREGEVIEFRATVQLGTAKEHAKWNVVSTIRFEQVDGNNFLFDLEPIGALSSTEIVKELSYILEERLGVVLQVKNERK